MRKLQYCRLHSVHLLCFHILRPCGKFQCLLRQKRQLDRSTVLAEEGLCDGDPLQQTAPWQPRPARVSDRKGCFCTMRQMASRNSCFQRSFFIGNPKVFHVPLL